MDYVIFVGLVFIAIVVVKVLEFFSDEVDSDTIKVNGKTYELIYNEKALFSPWEVVEVTIEGVAYKKYKTIASFERNEAALSYFNSISKK